MTPSLWSIARAHPWLARFFIAYYVGLVAYGVTTSKFQTIFYALFVGAGAVVVMVLYRKTTLSALTLWGLALWGLAHMVGGLIDLGGDAIYTRSWGAGELRFDKIVHFWGFGFATLASYELLRDRLRPDASARAVAIAAFFVGLGIGAVNETVEFLLTLLPTESNVGGFTNTGWDLVSNALGAAVASAAAPRLDTPERDPRTG